MIDCKKYSNKAFLKLLKANPKYLTAIAIENNWEDVVEAIDTLNLTYTKEQIEYVKNKEWD